eukprot:PhF_6_TR40930/c0_g1_i1/m.61919/K16675/ZDHHC9_14_18; palmitoyltransferase ZDHHC9/14/18
MDAKANLFHGRSTIRCNGLCISVHDSNMPHSIHAFSITVVALFCIFVAYEVHFIHVIIAVILISTTYIMTILGANSDPGICTPTEAEMVPPLPQTPADGSAPTVRRCRNIILQDRDVVEAVGPLKDNTYVRRFCGTCNIVRPVRVSHCPECDYCIHEFDHHCGVLGCCVGKRTWRYFTWYIVLTTFLCGYIFSVSLYSLIKREYTDDSLSRWSQVCAIGLCLLTSCVGISLFGLSANYLRMTYVNMTSRDTVHSDSYWDPEKGFPFDDGCVRNCWRRMCCPGPSTIKL